MKKVRKIFIISIIITVITITKNYAINETNNAANGVTQNNTQNVTSQNVQSNENNVNNTSNTQNSNKSTTNASSTILTSLGIRPYDFTGFKNVTTTYNVEVPENVTSVEIYATTQNPKAKLEGTGTKTLQLGKNVAQVTVIAEDGTTKTFTINIIRGEKKDGEEEKLETNTTIKNESINTNLNSGKGLKTLNIKDVTLYPTFQSNIYEYSAKYIGEATKLELETSPTDDSYIIEVSGNDDIQEGENTITILVSENNGDNVATYQITVNKSLIDEEAIKKEEEEKLEKQKNMIKIAIAIVALIVIIVIIIIIKRRNNEEDDDEYDDDDEELSIYKNNYDNGEEDEEEIPKAFKKINQKQVNEIKNNSEKKQDTEQYKKQNKDKEKIYTKDDIENNVKTVKRKYSEEENYEKMQKDRAKEQYLNNYLKNDDRHNYDEDIEQRRKKHKGKRFK